MRTYSDPALWEHSKEMARQALGGHSARAMQMAGKIYRAAGGRYIGKPTKAQQSLKRWTAQDWTTKSGRPSRETGERYLPRAAIEGLTSQEYAATTRAKRKGTAAGQQFVKQPKRIAAKVAAMKKPTPAQLAARARFAEMARSGAFKKGAKRKKNPISNAEKSAISFLFQIVNNPPGEKVNRTLLKKAIQEAIDAGVIVEKVESSYADVWNLTNSEGSQYSMYVDNSGRGTWVQHSKRKTNPTKKTVSQKISQLTREGYPQKQAVAVALSEERAGKVKRNPADPAPYGVSYTSAVTGHRRVIHHKTKAAALKDAKALYTEGAKDVRVFHYMKGTGAIDIDWHAMIARTAKPLKRNPATGRKGSGTKLNPMAAPARSPSQSNYKYSVEAKRFIPGGSTFEPVAGFHTKAQALDYANAILASHPGVTLRIKTYAGGPI